MNQFVSDLCARLRLDTGTRSRMLMAFTHEKENELPRPDYDNHGNQRADAEILYNARQSLNSALASATISLVNIHDPTVKRSAIRTIEELHTLMNDELQELELLVTETRVGDHYE